MDVDIPPDLHLQVRKIRNIEVWKSDLLPLIIGGRKIPSTPIDAFGAQLQQHDQHHDDYTIFSSWLGALVSGKAHEGIGDGTIEEHIKAAVSPYMHRIYGYSTYLLSSVPRIPSRHYWHHDVGFSHSAGASPYTGYWGGWTSVQANLGCSTASQNSIRTPGQFR